MEHLEVVSHDYLNGQHRPHAPLIATAMAIALALAGLTAIGSSIGYRAGEAVTAAGNGGGGDGNPPIPRPHI
jgi:hypothetical protein